MTAASVTNIGYDDVGTGEPAILCLPGWCGDRTVFDPLLPHLARHRRALSADLPDHGTSSPRRDQVDSTSIVDDLVTLITDADVKQVVPLSLSHAGWFAIELRRRLGPDRVPAIVLLDWMPLGPPPGFIDALHGLQDEDSWRQVRAGLFDLWTTDVDVPAVHGYVAGMARYGFRHWRRAGREIAASFTAENSPATALEALHTPCPTLHVYAQPADHAVLTAQQQFASEHPWFHVQRLDARSHFPTFEVADEIAGHVEEFLCPPR